MSDVPAVNEEPDIGLIEDKYVVFKREDWDKACFELDEALLMVTADSVSRPEIPTVADCFVVRGQDVFGAQALFGYAHLIQTALEVSALPGRGSAFTPAECEHLSALADELMERGLKWNRLPKKVPTP